MYSKVIEALRFPTKPLDRLAPSRRTGGLGLLAHGACQYQPLHLSSAFINFKHALVTVKPLDHARLAIAEAAPELHGAGGGAMRHFGPIELGHGAEFGDVAAPVIRASSLVKHHASR